MKTTFIVLMLTIPLLAQELVYDSTSLEPIEFHWLGVETVTVVHSIISGATIHYIIQDRNAYRRGNIIYRDYQKKWRLLLPLEYLSAVGVGFTIALHNKELNWLRIITDAAVAGMIRVNVRQWTYQLAGGRHMLNQPNSDWTFFPGIEKFTGAWIKIGVLAGVLIFKYVILELL